MALLYILFILTAKTMSLPPLMLSVRCTTEEGASKIKLFFKRYVKNSVRIILNVISAYKKLNFAA